MTFQAVGGPSDVRPNFLLGIGALVNSGATRAGRSSSRARAGQNGNLLCMD